MRGFAQTLRQVSRVFAAISDDVFVHLPLPGSASVCVRGSHAGPYLKTAVQRFKTFKRVEQFQAYLPHRLAGAGELLRALDGELDSVHGDPSLVGHLKFHRRGSGSCVGFDGIRSLADDF
jgi:hypothetical protein